MGSCISGKTGSTLNSRNTPVPQKVYDSCPPQVFRQQYEVNYQTSQYQSKCRQQQQLQCTQMTMSTPNQIVMGQQIQEDDFYNQIDKADNTNQQIQLMNLENNNTVQLSEQQSTQQVQSKNQQNLWDQIKSKTNSLREFLKNVSSAIQNFISLQRYVDQHSDGILSKDKITESIKTLRDIPKLLIDKYNSRLTSREGQMKGLMDKTQELNCFCNEYIKIPEQRQQSSLQDSSQEVYELYAKFLSDEESYQRQQDESILKFQEFIGEKYHLIKEKYDELVAGDLSNQHLHEQLENSYLRLNDFLKKEKFYEYDISRIQENIQQEELMIKVLEKQKKILSENLNKNKEFISQNEQNQQDQKRDSFQMVIDQLDYVKRQLLNMTAAQFKNSEVTKLQTLKSTKANLEANRESKNDQIKPIHTIYVVDGSGSMINSNNFQTCLDAIGKSSKEISKSLSSKHETFHTILQFSDTCKSAQQYGLKVDEINLSLIQYMNGGTNYNAAFEEIEQVIQQFQDKDHQFIVLFFTDGAPSDKPNPINLINIKSKLQKRFLFFGIAFQKVELLEKLVQQINQDEQFVYLQNGQQLQTFFQINQISQILSAFTNISSKMYEKRMLLIKEVDDIDKQIVVLNNKIKDEELELKKLDDQRINLENLIKIQNNNSEDKISQTAYLEQQCKADQLKLDELSKEIQAHQDNLNTLNGNLIEKQTSKKINENQLAKQKDALQKEEVEMNLKLNINGNNSLTLKVLNEVSKNFTNLRFNIDDYNYLTDTQKEQSKKIVNYSKQVIDTSNLILKTSSHLEKKLQLVKHLQDQQRNSQRGIFEDLISSKNFTFYKNILELKNHDQIFSFLSQNEKELFQAYKQKNEADQKQSIEQLLNNTNKLLQNKRYKNEQDSFCQQLRSVIQQIFYILDIQARQFYKLLKKYDIGQNCQTYNTTSQLLQHHKAEDLKLTENMQRQIQS